MAGLVNGDRDLRTPVAVGFYVALSLRAGLARRHRHIVAGIVYHAIMIARPPSSSPAAWACSCSTRSSDHPILILSSSDGWSKRPA